MPPAEHSPAIDRAPRALIVATVPALSLGPRGGILRVRRSDETPAFRAIDDHVELPVDGGRIGALAAERRAAVAGRVAGSHAAAHPAAAAAPRPLVLGGFLRLVLVVLVVASRQHGFDLRGLALGRIGLEQLAGAEPPLAGANLADVDDVARLKRKTIEHRRELRVRISRP